MSILTPDEHKMALVTYRLTDDEQRVAFNTLSGHDAALRAELEHALGNAKRAVFIAERLFRDLRANAIPVGGPTMASLSTDENELRAIRKEVFPDE